MLSIKLCVSDKLFIRFRNVAATQSLIIFSKSQILAEKYQSLNEGEKTWPSKDPACNLQNLLDDSFFRDHVHQIQ